MKKIQTASATALALISGAGLAFNIYLIFIFPRKIAAWEEEAAALSVLQTGLIRLSDLSKTFGIIILPLLLALTVGGIAWAVISMVRTQK